MTDKPNLRAVQEDDAPTQPIEKPSAFNLDRFKMQECRCRGWSRNLAGSVTAPFDLAGEGLRSAAPATRRTTGRRSCAFVNVPIKGQKRDTAAPDR